MFATFPPSHLLSVYSETEGCHVTDNVRDIMDIATKKTGKTLLSWSLYVLSDETKRKQINQQDNLIWSC